MKNLGRANMVCFHRQQPGRSNEIVVLIDNMAILQTFFVFLQKFDVAFSGEEKNERDVDPGS
jgi:hypothetical protein